MKKLSKSRKKQRRIVRNRLLLLVFIILVIVIIILINNNSKKGATVSADLDFKSEIFNDIGSSAAKISEYIVYGTHLNLEGTLNISNSSIDNVKLILKSKDNEDISIPTKYTIEGSTLEFTTGEKV